MKNKKNKICVYTCLTENDDDLQEVELIEKNIDYLCFTNNKNLKSDTWKIILIEDSHLNNQQLFRKIKILGHSYIFENYDISVWIEPTVVFRQKVEDFVKTYLKDNSFAAFTHSKSANDEAAVCCRKGKDTKQEVLEITDFLKKEKFPKNNSLYETEVLIKKHHEKQVTKTMELWFDTVCKYSMMNQLSLEYSIWKTGMKIDTINLNIWDNPWFDIKKCSAKQEVSNYKIQFGEDSTDFDTQGHFKIENNKYTINTIIPKDTTSIIMEFSDITCVKYKNSRVNKMKVDKIVPIHTISFNDNTIFYKNGAIQLTGNFKKNETLNFSIELENLTNEETLDFINHLISTTIEKDATIQEVKKELEIKQVELTSILSSKSWKVTKPLRFFTSKMNRANLSNTKEKIKKEILWYMPKAYAHKKIYKQKVGKNLNLENPIDFNEKLQYLMVYKYGKKEGYLADKIAVKEYIMEKKIPDLYVPKTLKTYKNANEINLEELPDKFVLKCNHSSGNVVICNNKENFDFATAKNILEATRKKNFAKVWFEYHYNYIKPLIYAEEYLDDNSRKNPLDFKIYCTKGKAQSILVCSERDTGLRLNEFDLEWNDLNLTKEEWRNKENIPKPKNLDKMIKIAEKLSQDLPFVRVDLYEINDRIYFGELTFSPAAGICDYYDENSLLEHGKLIDLNDYQ